MPSAAADSTLCSREHRLCHRVVTQHAATRDLEDPGEWDRDQWDRGQRDPGQRALALSSAESIPHPSAELLQQLAAAGRPPALQLACTQQQRATAGANPQPQIGLNRQQLTR